MKELFLAMAAGLLIFVVVGSLAVHYNSPTDDQCKIYWAANVLAKHTLEERDEALGAMPAACFNAVLRGIILSHLEETP